MDYQTQKLGYTLVETVGVLAIIAILGSVTAPKLFASIEDAKVSDYIAQIYTLTSAVAQFKIDTGKWPRHEPSAVQQNFHQLMTNSLNGEQPIPGWNGPYLEMEMANYISKGSYQNLFVVKDNDPDWGCDINGDGTVDGQFIVYRSDGINDRVAIKISNVIDGDGRVTAGNGNWGKAGNVRRYQGLSDSILQVCLTAI